MAYLERPYINSRSWTRLEPSATVETRRYSKRAATRARSKADARSRADRVPELPVVLVPVAVLASVVVVRVPAALAAVAFGPSAAPLAHSSSMSKGSSFARRYIGSCSSSSSHAKCRGLSPLEARTRP